MSVEHDQELHQPDGSLSPPLTVEELRAMWVAGLLEIGGSIFFAKIFSKELGDYYTAEPVIQIESRDTNVITNLVDYYQGFVSRQDRRWSITEKDAVALMEKAAPWLVSRKTYLEAMLTWKELNDEDKLQLALDFKGFDRYEGLTAAQYAELVKKPAFLAGVLDNREFIRPYIVSGFSYPSIMVTSVNIALLEALQAEYKGTLTKLTDADTEVEIAGHPAILGRASYRWNITTALARKVLTMVKPYLKIPLYEGWDYLYSDTVKAARNELSATLHDFILYELGEFEQGSITHMTLNDELQIMFSLTEAQLDAHLDHLPDEIREKRESLIMASSRVFTRKEAEAAAADLEAEIDRYLGGKLAAEELRTNQQLAKELGVSENTLLRWVRPLLPSEKIQARARAITSLSGKKKRKNP
ncbi:MAG TPA: hypothetical protein VD999_01870 [Vitreimonas sp.]|nr:hypothetical protein [Vitreimonas sp.]